MKGWDGDHGDSGRRDKTASPATHVTAAGADWLASASRYPRSVQALWLARPEAQRLLPCGTVFDAVSLPFLFGRRVVDQMWASGPGCGPVAAHQGRIFIFCKPGVANRLPALLSWEEWGSHVPPPLCHSIGDAVTVPPLQPSTATASRWVVAPDTRQPWLPGVDILLWACIRAARAEAANTLTPKTAPVPVPFPPPLIDF